MKKYLILLLTFFALTLSAQEQPARVPARHGVILREQPSGDTLHIFLRGDEWSHFTMTVDGWQVMENNKGALCYCKLKTRKINGEKQQVAVITRRVAHDADKRSKCEQRWLNRRGIQKLKND